MPASTVTATDTRTAAQKAADTRKANKLAKDAAAAKAKLAAEKAASKVAEHAAKAAEKESEKAASVAAKAAEKAAAVAAKAASETAANAAKLQAIDSLEGEVSVLLADAQSNLAGIAARFLRLYPLAPWKVRGVSIADYYAGHGVSTSETDIDFPRVIRQAVVVAMWAGSEISDQPARPEVPATDDTPKVPGRDAIVVSPKVREMVRVIMGMDASDATDTRPAIASDAPVTHLEAMTGASKASIARDRRELGLVDDVRSTANTDKHDKPADTDAGEGEGEGEGTGHTAESLAGVIASITDPDLLRIIIRMASERLTALESAAA